jgi:hypothetical protein
MKYAYVALQEPFSLGVRIVQIQDTKDGLVDVDGVLIWVDCADDVTTSDFYYDTADSQIKPISVTSQPVSTGTQTL